MPTEIDIALLIKDIKDEMRKLKKLQRQYLDEEKIEKNEERKKRISMKSWATEGEIIGLHRACELIKDRFVEYYPELLEKETCEVKE